MLCSQVFLCEGEGCTDNDTNILHYNHIALAFLTGFLFATHLPERLAPGSFDYIGKTDLRSSYYDWHVTHWFVCPLCQPEPTENDHPNLLFLSALRSTLASKVTDISLLAYQKSILERERETLIICHQKFSKPFRKKWEMDGVKCLP